MYNENSTGKMNAGGVTYFMRSGNLLKHSDAEGGAKALSHWVSFGLSRVY
jgi:hypothetical protein